MDQIRYHKSLKHFCMLGVSLSMLAACETMPDKPMEPMGSACHVLKNQPDGFGGKVDFEIASTIVAVIDVSAEAGGVGFAQKFDVLEGNASDNDVEAAIAQLSKGGRGKVDYNGDRVIDPKGALDIDLDNINGKEVLGSVKIVLSLAPENWAFAKDRGLINFKADGNPNAGGIPEFYKLSQCDRAGQTISVLDRNATTEKYLFDYQVTISGEKSVTIDPGTDNNGTGPGMP